MSTTIYAYKNLSKRIQSFLWHISGTVYFVKLSLVLIQRDHNPVLLLPLLMPQREYRTLNSATH